MIYEYYVIRKLKKQSMDNILKMGKELRQKKNKPNEWLFKLMYKHIELLCKVEPIVKKYNLMCYNRSLVLYYLASKCGIDIAFCIGFRKKITLEQKRILVGHAWIEWKGEVLEKDNKVKYYIKNSKYYNYEKKEQKNNVI